MSQTGNENSRKCILAVDDTVITLSRICDVLGNDYEVITVNSGMRAIRYLEKEKPDLILLDIRMEPKDGLETLRDIRAMKDRSDIPVVMLTGMEEKKTVLESAKLGICDYILKPFNDDELLSRVRRILEPGEEDSMQKPKGWRSMNQY